MKQILIADARKENILSAMLILESNSIIFPAKSKNWMMKVLKCKNIDLIILNTSIAGADTLGVMKKIRKSEKYKNVPFVITGGSTINEIDIVTQCIQMEKCEAIVLPFDNEELLEMVESL